MLFGNIKGQTAGSCNDADKYKCDRLYMDPKKVDTSVREMIPCT